MRRQHTEVSIITHTAKTTQTFRFAARDEAGCEVGRAWLYIINNDLHAEPYGFLEDLYVAPEARGRGIATGLHEAVVAQACHCGCYKLIATSRNDGTRTSVHEWYERLGYTRHGIEFRMEV